jgi:hypothetical protein
VFNLILLAGVVCLNGSIGSFEFSLGYAFTLNKILKYGSN